MKKRAKRRTPAIIAGLVAIVAIIAVSAYLFPILKVSEIKVEGATHADTQQVATATGIDQGENMVRIDTGQAARNVSGVPWVEKVTVSRSWPNTVRVEITEHQSVGYIKDGGDVLAVNTHGHVFLRGVKPEGAVEFDGVDPQDTKAIQSVSEAITALKPEVRGQLERVKADNAEAIEMFFREDRRVFWGSSDRASEKAEATRVVLKREGKRWNVSNPAMPTLRA